MMQVALIAFGHQRMQRKWKMARRQGHMQMVFSAAGIALNMGAVVFSVPVLAWGWHCKLIRGIVTLKAILVQKATFMTWFGGFTVSIGNCGATPNPRMLQT